MDTFDKTVAAGVGGQPDCFILNVLFKIRKENLILFEDICS